MATSGRELKCLEGLLYSLGVTHKEPMRLYCNSQASLHIAKNPISHKRTKHIQVNCHFVVDYLQCDNIATCYV